MFALLPVLLAASAVLYTLAAVAHILYMFRRFYEWLARWSTRAAWGLHSLSLLLLVLETGKAPVHTLFEFSSLFTWFMMSQYIFLEVLRKNQAAGAFLVPAIALVQIFSIALPKPTSSEIFIEEFPVSLIAWHIGLIFLGYALFFASFVAAALYLLQERNLRRKKWGPLYYRLPSLETLDIWGGRFVYLGFPLLTIGMFAGLFFAHVTWDTFWQADPKVIFTVIVWALYGGYLIMRKVYGWGGKKAAWWSVVGVAAVLINYFVMNLLSTQHRFGV